MTKTVIVNRNLAALIYRAVRARRLPYNYCCGWYDISGRIGIHLANADWVGHGVYINPHTHR